MVLEVGSQVTEFAIGDRVMGLVPAGFGDIAISEARTLVRIPSGWSFIEAGGTPVAFLTAYYALVDLAELEQGERVLVHAAAGLAAMLVLQALDGQGTVPGMSLEVGLRPPHVEQRIWPAHPQCPCSRTDLVCRPAASSRGGQATMAG